MPRTEVIAKRDLYPIFKKGDKATIVPVLYEEDTLIHNEIHGIFNANGDFVKIFEMTDIKRNFEGCEIKKMHEKLYAPKGSYKSSYIELEDGRQYPSSLVRRYKDFFEKV